jgi:MYXO-CTERM domain-containing protein
MQLLGVLEAHPYLTRLYTRVSAEEMTVDPIFGRSALGDVSRQHQLSRIVNGVDQCSEDMRPSTDPCDFATCGAGGLCRPVPARAIDPNTAEDAQIAGCACVPGATARPTFAPDGSATVICQDGRMSFLNAGDRENDSAPVLPDACAGFSCGENGQCVAVNMTPTCVCDQGFVAVGTAAQNGSRGTRCVEPPELVPAVFYQGRLPNLPSDLPGGREVTLSEPLPMPGTDPSATPTAGFPMPRTNPVLITESGGGCGMAAATPSAPWLLALAFGAAALRRRRSEVS